MHTNSNFEFLREHDPIYFQLTSTAEWAFANDPNTTLIKLRQFGEALARDLATRFRIAFDERISQADLLFEINREVRLDPTIRNLFHTLRIAVFANQIEARVKTAQAQVNKLTQSILAKAFRGELTAEWRAQNPDLISGENSAEASLARIQAERGKTEKPAKARKNKNVEAAAPVADDLPAGQLSLPGLVLPEALEAGR